MPYTTDMTTILRELGAGGAALGVSPPRKAYLGALIDPLKLIERGERLSDCNSLQDGDALG